MCVFISCFIRFHFVVGIYAPILLWLLLTQLLYILCIRDYEVTLIKASRVILHYVGHPVIWIRLKR